MRNVMAGKFESLRIGDLAEPLRGNMAAIALNR